MTTDWNLIRQLLKAAVDACEAHERLQLTEQDRGRRTGHSDVTVMDVLTSAWTYPETLQYAVIRARHDLNADASYRPEAARVLREVGALCGELVGAPVDQPLPRTGTRAGDTIRSIVEPLGDWYTGQMTPQLRAAATTTDESG